MTEVAIRTRDILSRALRLARVLGGKVIFAFGLMAALAIGIDLQAPDNLVLSFLVFAVSIYFQYDLTVTAMIELGVMPGGFRPTRQVAMLGMCLISQTAIALGYLLFVVPGLLLTARWILASPILIADEAGAIESLALSWQETAGRFKPILLAVLVIYLPLLVAVGVSVWMMRMQVETSYLVIATDIISYGCLVMGWLAAVAVYSLRAGSPARLEQVFA